MRTASWSNMNFTKSSLRCEVILLSLTDARNHTTIWSYDTMDRPAVD